MRRYISTQAAVAVVVVLALQIHGVAQAPEDPAHNELRALRTQVVEAITSGDIEKTLAYLHPNVVVTWQNHEVCRGHQGVRDFMDRLGRDAFRGYKVPPSPDELTILYGGDTGISFGTTVSEVRLLGTSFEFTNRWTATLVNENGRWMLASYHVSNNVLDNPLLRAAERSLVLAVGGGLLIGFAVGMLIGRRRRRAA